VSRPVVICVDDEKLVLDSMRQQLRRNLANEVGIEAADSGEDALELFDELQEEGVDVPIVLSDHLMPGMKGTEVLARIHARDQRTLTILLTGQADAHAIGDAVNRAGLYRYIAKPWAEDDLVLTLREALRRYFDERRLESQNRELERLNTELRNTMAELEKHRERLEAENVYLRAEIDSEHGFDEIIGRSAALSEVLAQVERVAPADATVLILGESGTGKELIARAIHEASARRSCAMVRVNCAALPAQLIESELFGHAKGAFSGAIASRVGRFEMADGGTIFLDEIGELPLELQAKLLRVLQEGELERLGDSRPIQIDVRVVAATNRDLRREVAEGRFREDLYYRLAVFPIHVPPLRERAEDIELLAHYFTKRFATRLGRRIDAISRASLDDLRAHHWPGNVRELQNVIERAVILARGPILAVEVGKGQTLPRPTAEPSPLRTLREMEIDLITQALESTDWVVGGKRGAARVLDIPASTLRERIKKYGITRG
jgi:DNA-binding NtrC family response regulator